jgi:hypothetical protein
MTRREGASLAGEQYIVSVRCGTAKASTPSTVDGLPWLCRLNASKRHPRMAIGHHRGRVLQAPDTQTRGSRIYLGVATDHAVMGANEAAVDFTGSDYLAGDPPLTRSKAVRAVSSAVGKVWRYFSSSQCLCDRGALCNDLEIGPAASNHEA